MAELLYSKSYAGFVLGSIMCDTALLNPTKYPLEKYDFAPSLTQKLIFVSIAMLRDSGAKKIEPKEIAELLSNYPQYEEALKSLISVRTSDNKNKVRPVPVPLLESNVIVPFFITAFA